MSQAASQAEAFRREVAETRTVWTLEDERGIPAPENREGRRAMPFWSSNRRVERAIESGSGWSGCHPRELSLDEFRSRWLPGLAQDGLLAGVNWTGERLTGYDVEPDIIEAWFAET